MRQFHTGFELGVNSYWNGIGSDLRNGFQNDPTNARNGSYYFLTSNGIGDLHVPIWHPTLVGTTFFIRYGFKFSGAGQGGVLSLLDAAGNHICGVGFADATGHLKVFRGDWTVVYTSAVALLPNRWYTVEAMIKIDAAAGQVQLKIDGAADALSSGLNTGTGTVAMVGCGSNGALGGHSFDDIAVNDDQNGPNGETNNKTWIGDSRVGVKKVTVDGDHIGLNGTFGSATHSQNVDELPANDATDYNYDNAAAGTNNYDLYQLSTLPNVGSINALAIYARAQKDDAGTGNAQLVQKTHAVEYRGPVHGLSQSWAWYVDPYEVNPNTGAPYTAAEEAALQAGFDAQ